MQTGRSFGSVNYWVYMFVVGVGFRLMVLLGSAKAFILEELGGVSWLDYSQGPVMVFFGMKMRA